MANYTKFPSFFFSFPACILAGNPVKYKHKQRMIAETECCAHGLTPIIRDYDGCFQTRQGFGAPLSFFPVRHGKQEVLSMIILANGRVITRNPGGVGYLPDGGVAADGGTIVEVSSTTDLKSKYPQAEFVDARGGVIMPGLINAHTPYLLRPGPGASPSTATTPPTSTRCWTASGGISTGIWTWRPPAPAPRLW